MNLQQTSSNELYELLSPDIAQELRKHEKYTTVRPGTKLVGHGDLPKDLIIVNTGSVEISLAAGSQMISIAVAGSGKVLGLRPVISGASSEIEATTLEECSVLFVPKQQFLEVLKQHPEIYIAIARILSTDLKAAERVLRDLRGATGREKQHSFVMA